MENQSTVGLLARGLIECPPSRSGSAPVALVGHPAPPTVAGAASDLEKSPDRIPCYPLAGTVDLMTVPEHLPGCQPGYKGIFIFKNMRMARSADWPPQQDQTPDVVCHGSKDRKIAARRPVGTPKTSSTGGVTCWGHAVRSAPFDTAIPVTRRTCQLRQTKAMMNRPVRIRTMVGAGALSMKKLR